MRILTSIPDVRKFRQISKQINIDSFNAHMRVLQQTDLLDLLGAAMHYDFFNWLDNDWLDISEPTTRDSDTQLTVIGADLTGFVDYSLRINNDVFVIVTNAVLSGVDTILTVIGYQLPTVITTLDYKTTNKYTKLLNGTTYISNGNTVQYFGLRNFLSFCFLLSYNTDGDVKQADLGNVSFMGDNFGAAASYKIKATASNFGQSKNVYRNNIVAYLDTNSSVFSLWESTGETKITNLDFIIM